MDDYPTTLFTAVQVFADEDWCAELLADIRWPEQMKCPHCHSTNVGYLENQKRYKCYGPRKHKGKQFSVRTNTIFEESAIPLGKWFTALWMISNCKNGVSSWETHRAIGITQKSAWHVLHRIRDGLKTRKRRLEGVVEVDESFHGGRYRWMHSDRRRTKPEKVIVLGLYQR